MDTRQQTLLCPVSRCAGTMLLQSQGASPYDPLTGLETWVCACCGFSGLRVRDGIQLTFSDRREYCFSYGPSLATLVIILSPEAVNLFAETKWSSVQLATYLAEWTLLMGRTQGTVQFSLNAPVLSDCYAYWRRQMQTSLSPSAPLTRIL